MRRLPESGAVFALVLAVMLPAPAAAGIEAREWGLQFAGGVNPSSGIQFYALQPYVGLSLWRPAERWLAERGIDGTWVVEPWAAFVSDRVGPRQTDSFEIGVNALLARLRFGHARLRPFIEGGEGIAYTDLRKQGLGSRIQFTSQIGAGLDWALGPDRGLLLAARFRHLSNAGIARGNPGINTIYGVIGFSFR